MNDKVNVSAEVADLFAQLEKARKNGDHDQVIGLNLQILFTTMREPASSDYITTLLEAAEVYEQKRAEVGLHLAISYALDDLIEDAVLELRNAERLFRLCNDDIGLIQTLAIRLKLMLAARNAPDSFYQALHTQEETRDQFTSLSKELFERAKQYPRSAKYLEDIFASEAETVEKNTE